MRVVIVIMGVRTRETIPYKRKKSSMNIPAVSDIKGNNMTKTLFLTRRENAPP